MLKLTTDYGEFTAESEKELMVLARKARREAIESDKKKMAEYAKAKDKAMINGYRIYSVHAERSAENKTAPGGWVAYGPESNYMGKYFGYDEHKIYRTLHVEYNDGVGKDSGSAKFETYTGANDLILAIIDGSGYIFGIVLRDKHDGTETVYTVGASGNSVAICPVEGVDYEWFTIRN